MPNWTGPDDNPEFAVLDMQHRHTQLLGEALQPVAAVDTRWRLTERQRKDLRELRRDFRQGLPQGEHFYAVRIQGNDGADVPWRRLEYPFLDLADTTFALGETSKPSTRFRTIPLVPLEEAGRSVAYGLIDLPEMRPNLYNDYVFGTAIRSLAILRASGLEQAKERKNWHGAVQWLRLLFANGWLTGTGINCDSCTAYAFSDDDAAPIDVQSDNLALDARLPKAFEYEAIQLLKTDLMLASANFIDWLLQIEDLLIARAGGGVSDNASSSSVVSLTPAGLEEKIGISAPTIRRIRKAAGLDNFGRGKHGRAIPHHEIAQMARTRTQTPRFQLAEGEVERWAKLLEELGLPPLSEPLQARKRH